MSEASHGTQGPLGDPPRPTGESGESGFEGDERRGDDASPTAAEGATRAAGQGAAALDSGEPSSTASLAPRGSTASDEPEVDPLDEGRGEPLLRARGIRKSYPVGDRRLEVLHGVDLEVRRGELLGLMGSSGAGKTTLLNILGLLDQPTEGQVWIDGRDGWALGARDRARLRNERIGFVFQFYHLLPELSAVENATLPAMIAHSTLGWRSRKRYFIERAREMLVDFGLEARLDHRPGQLSGGEQQRVAIARALLLDPPLLIADEPTGNLDRGTGERVLELLFREQERRSLSMLLVTHDEKLAKRCGHVVYLDDGQIAGDSSTPIPH